MLNYSIQIQYGKQGNFENTVYTPMSYERAFALLNQLRVANGDEHNYILVANFN